MTAEADQSAPQASEIRNKQFGEIQERLVARAARLGGRISAAALIKIIRNQTRPQPQTGRGLIGGFDRISNNIKPRIFL